MNLEKKLRTRHHHKKVPALFLGEETSIIQINRRFAQLIANQPQRLVKLSVSGLGLQSEAPISDNLPGFNLAPVSVGAFVLALGGSSERGAFALLTSPNAPIARAVFKREAAFTRQLFVLDWRWRQVARPQ